MRGIFLDLRALLVPLYSAHVVCGRSADVYTDYYREYLRDRTAFVARTLDPLIS